MKRVAIPRLLLLTSLTVLLGLTAGCSRSSHAEYDVILVRVPPEHDSTRTAGENQCRFLGWLYPTNSGEANDCVGVGLRNDDSLLWVKLREDATLTLNSERVATVTTSEVLSERLSLIFHERREAGVFEPNGKGIARGVAFSAPAGTQVKDVLSALRAIEEGGATPIILVLPDHLPNI